MKKIISIFVMAILILNIYGLFSEVKAENIKLSEYDFKLENGSYVLNTVATGKIEYKEKSPGQVSTLYEVKVIFGEEELVYTAHDYNFDPKNNIKNDVLEKFGYDITSFLEEWNGKETKKITARGCFVIEKGDKNVTIRANSGSYKKVIQIEKFNLDDEILKATIKTSLEKIGIYEIEPNISNNINGNITLSNKTNIDGNNIRYIGIGGATGYKINQETGELILTDQKAYNARTEVKIISAWTGSDGKRYIEISDRYVVWDQQLTNEQPSQEQVDQYMQDSVQENPKTKIRGPIIQGDYNLQGVSDIKNPIEDSGNYKPEDNLRRYSRSSKNRNNNYKIHKNNRSNIFSISFNDIWYKIYIWKLGRKSRI